MPRTLEYRPASVECGTCGGNIIVASNAGRIPGFCSAKCRKASYGNDCVDCGKRTDGSNGRALAAKRCQACETKHLRSDPDRRSQCSGANRRWTDEDIFTAIRSVSRDGVAKVNDYTLVRDRRSAPMPSVPTIIARFGSWSAGVEAAGCRISPQGERLKGPRSDRFPIEGLLLAIQECAAAIGGAPSYAQYGAWASEVGAPSAALIRIRFGTWLTALDEAGVWA